MLYLVQTVILFVSAHYKTQLTTESKTHTCFSYSRFQLKRYSKTQACCVSSAMVDSSMETLDTEPSSPSTTIHSKPQISSPLPSSVLRLWRQAAQRNLRNQWPLLASFKDKWSSISSTSRSYATALVNSHLSHRYIPNMKLGVLSDMPDIRKEACLKLFKQQESHRSQLLLSYKDMVGVVSKMVNVSRSMRCFFRGSNNSPLLQFSNYSDQSDSGDSGDGGEIPVFAFLSISSHEKLVEELVQMFKLELILKLYADEFKDLSDCNLFCEATRGPVPPRLRNGKSDMSSLRFNNRPNPEVLQVYLTSWLAEVNIDTSRVNEIFAVVGEEMHVTIG